MLFFANNVRQKLAVGAILGILLPMMPLSGMAADAEDAAQIVAAEARTRGYACEDPAKATRNSEASTADKVVWRLECENATYRVRLIPNMAAEVEELEQRDREEGK